MRELLRILSEPLLSSVEAIRWLFKISVWKHVFRLFLPMILIYGITYIVIFVFSFIQWEPPYAFPIPFTENLVPLEVDRTLIVVGIILICVLYIEEHN